MGGLILALLAALPSAGAATASDWLLDPSQFEARAAHDEGTGRIVLQNGLVRREWLVEPAGACVALDELTTGAALLRSVRPEARVTLNGVAVDVGGLVGQPNHAYLAPAWLEAMEVDPNAMQLVGWEFGEPAERLAWKRVRHCAPDVVWPPRGVALRMDYRMPARADLLADVRVSVHYELYDGIPLFSKWISVRNGTDEPIAVDRFTAEELAVVESASWVETRDGVPLPRPDSLHVETDFAFGGFNAENANRHAVHWRTDPLYTTQVNWERRQPCRLVVEPTYGPAQDIPPGGTFESFRVFELAFDSTDRERRALALRRMYRTLAPWVTENPLMHHLRVADPKEVRRAIDQAAALGFEMIILSFGSGFDIENEDPEYVRTWKELADHARASGVEIGGYSLLSSRTIGDGNDVVSPAGESPTHGSCPALTSDWGQAYFANLYRFFRETGFSLLEHDGPYPGDVDVTPRPPLQKGEADSRWAQWRVARDFYTWCRAEGIYLNTPDFYYLVGSNKCGMGYREVNWSLPRAQQVIHTRQNIYDGSWTKAPSMGWMFVPLTEYQGGGSAATIEPLDEHREHYVAMLSSNLGLGVQACYRGPRLYDTEATFALVKAQVDWFKRYRDILESDLIHGRRADGRDLDWMLHVNPRLEEKGMLVVYNPLEREVTRTLHVNLYYSGLTESAAVAHEDRDPESLALARDYSVELEVTVPARGMTWYVIR